MFQLLKLRLREMLVLPRNSLTLLPLMSHPKELPRKLSADITRRTLLGAQQTKEMHYSRMLGAQTSVSCRENRMNATPSQED